MTKKRGLKKNRNEADLIIVADRLKALGLVYIFDLSDKVINQVE